MDRESFMKKVEKTIESSPLEAVIEKDIKQKYQGENGKNGIYFLYNTENNIVYVGLAGNGKYTSFYHRMYGHGNSAHNKEPWFHNECKKYRFYRFPNAIYDDLKVIERLMIFKKGQPKYNDIGKINYDFDDICARIL